MTACETANVKSPLINNTQYLIKNLTTFKQNFSKTSLMWMCFYTSSSCLPSLFGHMSAAHMNGAVIISAEARSGGQWTMDRQRGERQLEGKSSVAGSPVFSHPISPGLNQTLKTVFPPPFLLFLRAVGNSQGVVSRLLGSPGPWGLPFYKQRSVGDLIFILCFNQNNMSQKTDCRSRY